MKLHLQNNLLEKISDIPILVNLKNGSYYSLNEAALFILKCFRRGDTTRKIAKKVSEDYQISFSRALNDVNDFVKKLGQAGFSNKGASRNKH